MQNKKHIPIDKLLEALKQNGFIIGTDTYLQLHKLLNAIDINDDFEQFHTYLSPLFAQNEKQQNQFYEIYFSTLKAEGIDVVLPTKEEVVIPEESKREEITSEELIPEKIKSKQFLYVIAVILTILITVSSYFIVNKFIDPKQIEITEITQEINKIENKSDTIKQEVDNAIIEKKELKKNKEDTIAKLQTINKHEKIPEIESDYNFRIKEKDSVIVKNDSLLNIVDAEKKEKEEQADIIEENIQQKINNSIRYTLIFLIIIFFVLYEIYSLLSRRLIAKRKKEQKSPFVWGIYINNQNIDLDSDMYSVANNMRYRTQSGTSKIDITKTINATLKNAGIIDLQYKHNTKPVEYLMLIDWSSEKNHQAQLFDYLYRTFIDNNVYIERFFYDADPRICWSDNYAEGIRIDKIQQKFPDAYLLVFGSGSKFINPLNNRLYGFTSVFQEWEQRALLSPVPSGEWGVQEVLLRNVFAVILPATTAGIIELTEHFNIKSGQESNLKDWKFNPQKAEKYIYITADNLLENQQVSQNMKIWIATCAIYPELYWDLTIAIGKTLENDSNFSDLHDLTSQENIAILARIDWFRTGKIPDTEREKLLNNKNILLEKYKTAAITTIIKVLEQNLPENKELKDSFAYNNFLMNIVVNKLMLKPKKRKERRTLEAKLKQLAQSSDEQDFVALEYISKRNSITNFLLPKKFKKHFFNKGNKIFGIKNSIKYTAVFLLILFTFTCNNKNLIGFEELPTTDSIENVMPVDTSRTATTDSIQNTVINDDNAYKLAQSQNTIPAFEEYLKYYPAGKHVQEANDAIDLIKQDSEIADWTLAKQIDTKKAYTDFIEKYPQTKYKPEVENEIAEFENQEEDDKAFYQAQDTNTTIAFEKYIINYPAGKHVQEANDAIDLIKQNSETADWTLAKNAGTIKAYSDFIIKYPETSHKTEAENTILKIEDKLDFSIAQTANTCQAYEAYLQQHPQGKHKSEAQNKTAELCNSNFKAPKMVFVKGGTFNMGSPTSEANRGSDETQHTVTVSDFYIGKYEVTQKQWKDIMGTNPSNFKGDNLPVENVSWDDIQEFLVKLNKKTGKTYRLPTEAEWEYAARAGTTTPFSTGNCLSTNQANYDGNYPYSSCNKGTYREQTTTVGSFSANAWGIYDMHGNVWEWCQDVYKSDYYSQSKNSTNPIYEGNGSYRVMRGGSWGNYASYCRSANRVNVTPTYRGNDLGFRLAKTN